MRGHIKTDFADREALKHELGHVFGFPHEPNGAGDSPMAMASRVAITRIDDRDAREPLFGASVFHAYSFDHRLRRTAMLPDRLGDRWLRFLSRVVPLTIELHLSKTLSRVVRQRPCRGRAARILMLSVILRCRPAG